MKSFFLLFLFSFLLIELEAQNRIEIEITTGEDDLAIKDWQYNVDVDIYNINVDINNNRPNHRRWILGKTNINGGQGYPSHSVRVISIPFSTNMTLDSFKNALILVSRVSEVTNANTIAKKMNAAGGADNWDLKKIVVTAIVVKNGVTQKYLLLDKTAHPYLKRFVYNNNYPKYFAYLNDNPPLISGGVTATSQASPISKIIVEIGTGGDDLRGGGDNVDVIVIGGTGAPLHNELRRIEFKNVNAGKKQNNFTTLRRERPLLPEEMDILLNSPIQITIEHTGGGGMNADNWDVDRIKITMIHKGQERILVDRAGTPIKRFTGDSRLLRINAE